MKKLILAISVLLFVNQANAQSAKQDPTTTPPVVKKTKAILTIDFISKGSGIDAESFTKIEEFIKTHPKKPAYETKQKGREGETKFILKLTELNKEEQKAFIADIKSLIIKHDLVLINGVAVKPKVNANPAGSPNTFRLVLSFISKGGGINIASHEKIMQYVEKHPKKPVFESKTWGREGETDYCFQLKELTADEQTVFIKDINKMITDKEMVFVHENQAYVKKGR